jgi:hypothetical protein
LSDYEKAFYDVLRKSGNIFIGRELNKYKTITFALEKGTDNNSFTITLHGAKWAGHDTIFNCDLLLNFAAYSICYPQYNLCFNDIPFLMYGLPYYKISEKVLRQPGRDLDEGFQYGSGTTISLKPQNELNLKHAEIVRLLEESYYGGRGWTFKTDDKKNSITF